jgi:hypothetical protein
VHGQAQLLEVVDALGNSRAINTAMMAITTSNSIRVNPPRPRTGFLMGMISLGMHDRNRREMTES